MRSFVQSSAQCSCPFATLCNRTTTPASHQYLLPRPANLTPRPQLTPPLLSTRTLCRRAAGCCMNAMRSRNRTVHAMHAHTLCERPASIPRKPAARVLAHPDHRVQPQPRRLTLLCTDKPQPGSSQGAEAQRCVPVPPRESGRPGEGWLCRCRQRMARAVAS